MSDIKQVIVMRNDLGMRKGKMIAQGAHASMAFLGHFLRSDVRDLTEEESSWIDGSFTKICVYVNSQEELLEIYSKAKDAGLTVHMITDSGKTEFNGVHTRTCLAIGPHSSEKINNITGHLPLL